MASLEQHIQLIKQANKITNRKTVYAAGAGLIPIPVIDAVTLLGIQMTMIQSIGKLYGIPFKKHLTKSLIGSLTSTIGSVGFIKLIPGLGTVLGGTTTAVAGGASTYALGRVFTQHFDQGGTLLDFDPVTSRAYFQQQYDAGQFFVGKQNVVEQANPSETISKVTTTKKLLLEETEQVQQKLAQLQDDITLLQNQSIKVAVEENSVAPLVVEENTVAPLVVVVVENIVAPLVEENTVAPLAVEENTLVDFTIIEGIGFKTDKVLKKAGINNMEALSKTSYSDLQKILKNAGSNFNFVDASTWAEQADLAVKGELEALKKLKKELIGGKRKKKK